LSRWEKRGEGLRLGNIKGGKEGPTRSECTVKGNSCRFSPRRRRTGPAADPVLKPIERKKERGRKRRGLSDFGTGGGGHSG